ncbi:unnamed protein product [Closterium sp. Naga37s-1]|nr:unnamed protein product [Closterium sp. Naga37s-1]
MASINARGPGVPRPHSYLPHRKSRSYASPAEGPTSLRANGSAVEPAAIRQRPAPAATSAPTSTNRDSDANQRQPRQMRQQHLHDSRCGGGAGRGKGVAGTPAVTTPATPATASNSTRSTPPHLLFPAAPPAICRPNLPRCLPLCDYDCGGGRWCGNGGRREPMQHHPLPCLSPPAAAAVGGGGVAGTREVGRLAARVQDIAGTTVGGAGVWRKEGGRGCGSRGRLK